MHEPYYYICHMDISKVLVCIFEMAKSKMDDMMNQKMFKLYQLVYKISRPECKLIS